MTNAQVHDCNAPFREISLNVGHINTIASHFTVVSMIPIWYIFLKLCGWYCKYLAGAQVAPHACCVYIMCIHIKILHWSTLQGYTLYSPYIQYYIV